MATELRTQIESLVFFHNGIHRHQAETLLLHNGIAGTYLLRPNEDNTKYVLSVRCQDAVKHYAILVDDGIIQFGQSTFNSIATFRAHLENKPLLAGADGIPTTLLYPYEYDVEECPIYDSVTVHVQSVVLPSAATPPALHLGVSSKAGYLHKYGSVLKKWKIRWCVLHKAELVLFANSVSNRPLERIDLTECTGMFHDINMGRLHCFRLTLPQRRFGDLILAADSESDALDWMHVLTFKAHTFTS